MMKFAYAAIAACSLLGACASEETDELMPTSDEEGVDAKADSAGGVFTYFEISQDLRKCAAPVCGGFFLDRLNHGTTRCVDGQYRETCYAPELDMSESGLSPGAFDKLVEAANQSVGDGVRAIVRGRFAKGNATPRPELGRFIVTEVWVSQSEAVSSGVFAKVMDNGIRCIVAPCPSLVEKGLNSGREANIAEVDFTEAGLTDSVQEEVSNDMFSDHGVIVAGYRFKVEPKAKGRTATAVFRRLLETPAQGACFIGGCSGQICSDMEGVISTCEARPEYACYHTATCERQTDGTCDWTPTPELEACLGN